MRFIKYLLPLLLLALPARAAVLFQGGEDIDMQPAITCGTDCGVATSTTTFRSTWARSSLSVVFNNGGDPSAMRWVTPNFTPTSDVWFHAQFCMGTLVAACGTNNASTSNSQMIRFIDDAGNAAIIVRGTGTNNQVKISSRTAGGVFTDLVTCTGAFGALLTQIDVEVKLDAATGVTTLYNNSVQICTFSGNTTNGDGSTHIQSVEISSPWTAAQQTGFWSEIIVADEDTRPMNLLTMYPTGNGNQVQWSPVNACTTVLNDNPFNDLVYASAGTNLLTQECAIYQTLPAGSFSVKTVAQTARVLKGGTGPQHFDFVTRFGGSDFYSSDQSPNFSFQDFQFYQTTNPSTSLGWTTSDLVNPGLQFGLYSKP